MTGVAGAYFLTAPRVPLSTELLAGTQFQLVGYDSFRAEFAVPRNGTLVGGWAANTTVCEFLQNVLLFPPRVSPPVCSTSHTFQDALQAGFYVLAFYNLGATQTPPSPNGSATVTVVQTIQVVYS